MIGKSGRAKRVDQGPNKARIIKAWPGIRDGNFVKFRKTIGRHTREDVGIISFEPEAPSNPFLFIDVIITAQFPSPNISMSLYC